MPLIPLAFFQIFKILVWVRPHDGIIHFLENNFLFKLTIIVNSYEGFLETYERGETLQNSHFQGV